VYKNARGYLAFLSCVLLSVCFSVCVLSLLQSCFVLFIQLFLGEWSSMLASPPPPICLSRWSPFSAVRRGTAVHTCIPPNYFTVTNWLLPSLTLSSSYLSLSLFLTLSPQCTHGFPPLHLHLSHLDIVYPLLLFLFHMHALLVLLTISEVMERHYPVPSLV